MPRDEASAQPYEPAIRTHEIRNEAHSSGVSWGAVIGGAFVAAAFYLILLALGAGLGLSSVSPWTGHGFSAAAAGAAAIVWLIFIEAASSALGGYLTGRLRTKWTLIHDDEVYFRDTANGFLAWAVALIVSVTFLVTAGASMAGNPESPVATASADGNAYYVDLLFRSDAPSQEADLPLRTEAARILDNALRQPDIPAADRDYLSREVARKSNLSMADANRRVADVIGQARQAEDTARKAAARFLLWMFVALIVGAFSASYAATIGGRQRDHVRTI
jgi:hypothetical protein